MHIPLLLKNLLLSGLLNALSLAPSDKRWSDSLLSLQNTAHSGSVRSSHTGLSMPLTDRMEKMSDTRSDIFVFFRVRSVHSCGGARLSASVTEVFYENSGSRHPSDTAEAGKLFENPRCAPCASSTMSGMFFS